MKTKTKFITIALILCCLLVCALSITMIFAETLLDSQQVSFAVEYVPSDNWAKLTFTLSEDGKSYSVKAKSSYISGEVVIPSTYNDIPVTTIEHSGFHDCIGVTNIIIPSNIKSIEYDAFRNCTGLTEITIPSSVTNIEYMVFNGCKNLASIIVEEGNPVYHVTNNCLIKTSTKELVRGCKDSVIPTDGSVTSIDEFAFSYCVGLVSITIPDCVTSMGQDVFYNCTNLEHVTLSNNLTSIPRGTFGSCKSLTNITIPDSVITIGFGAFDYNPSLTSITIPKGVTSIDRNIVQACPALESIIVESGNTAYHVNGNCLIETASKTLIAGCKNSVIPADGTVTILEMYAFMDCTGLTNITIPSGITSIGDSAFGGCTGLTEITIPSSVTSVGAWAFSGCTGLTNVVISNGVVSLGQRSFDNCSALTSITIPESVTRIDSGAFARDTSLTNVYFTETTGWIVANTDYLTSGDDLDSSALGNSSTAATYLTSTYVSKWWKRS